MQAFIFEIIWIIYKVATMRYEDAILIILTALGVLLASLGIGIGLFAIIGYVSLRDGVKQSVMNYVSQEMSKTLKDYPPSDLLNRLTRDMESGLESLSYLQNQLVTSPQPKTIANASDSGIKEKQAGEPEKPIEIQTYPAQEATDASSTAAGGPPNTDPGPNPH